MYGQHNQLFSTAKVGRIAELLLNVLWIAWLIYVGYMLS